MPGDALTDALPGNRCCIIFKSMLHDWPEHLTDAFIKRAYDALRPGGELVIFERGPLDLTQPIPFSELPMLLFNRNFREPKLYSQQAEEAGFKEIRIKTLELESEFFILTATK